MKGNRRRLHETPPEFQKAKEAQAARLAWEQQACGYRICKSEEEAKREKIRNSKMPAHRLPRGKRRLLYVGQGVPVYEDEADYRRRVWNRAHRRAHKTTEPPKG